MVTGFEWDVTKMMDNNTLLLFCAMALIHHQ